MFNPFTWLANLFYWNKKTAGDIAAVEAMLADGAFEKDAATRYFDPAGNIDPKRFWQHIGQTYQEHGRLLSFELGDHGYEVLAQVRKPLGRSEIIFAQVQRTDDLKAKPIIVLLAYWEGWYYYTFAVADTFARLGSRFELEKV